MGAVIGGATLRVAQQRIGDKDLAQPFVGAGIRPPGTSVGVVVTQVAPVGVRDLGLGRTRRYTEYGVGVANCWRLGGCTWPCLGAACRTAVIGWWHNSIPRDWPGYASCGPVGATAPFVSSSSGSVGHGSPDQWIPLVWRAHVRPIRVKRRPWAMKPESKPCKGTPNECVTKTHSAVTVSHRLAPRLSRADSRMQGWAQTGPEARPPLVDDVRAIHQNGHNQWRCVRNLRQPQVNP